MRHLIDEFKQRAAVDVMCSLRLDESTTVSSEVGLCAYRVLQEALTNVRRHARANSVRVTLSSVPDELHLEVQDDGVGFEGGESDANTGCGLQGMRERVNLVGGDIDVRSAQFQGTRVSLTVPLRQSIVREDR